MPQFKKVQVNFYVITENRSLLTGINGMVENVFSRQDKRHKYNVYQIADPAKLVIAMLRNGNCSIAIFDSESYLFYELMLAVETIKNTNVAFKSLLLCSPQEKKKFHGFYRSLFDINMDKKANTYHIETGLSLMLKTMLDEHEYGEQPAELMPSVYTPFLKLTSQEAIVLNDIFRGKNTHEIARKLFISEKTVHAHRQRIYLKFNVHSLSELYFYIRNSTLISV
ncbi:hypothetical protein GE278_20365 [Enterobacteriaceae bacterium Kacie_13]|nr:hypothetical protein GE278_20365 [Enterobacteriaceae bacterium Kacie_13]